MGQLVANLPSGLKSQPTLRETDLQNFVCSSGLALWGFWPNYFKHICFRSAYMVVYRPIAKLWLCKQQPLLGDARNIHEHNRRTVLFCVVHAATVAMQEHSKNTSTTIERLCFLRGLCQEVILKAIGTRVQMWSVNQLAVVWPWKLKNPHC
jgi:steroid 5-alpha reductase family enzyme